MVRAVRVCPDLAEGPEYDSSVHVTVAFEDSKEVAHRSMAIRTNAMTRAHVSEKKGALFDRK